MSKRPPSSLVQTSVALPAPLLSWLDAEALAHGTSRNAHLTLLLAIHRQTGSNAELQRRVSAIEHRMKTL